MRSAGAGGLLERAGSGGAQFRFDRTPGWFVPGDDRAEGGADSAAAGHTVILSDVQAGET